MTINYLIRIKKGLHAGKNVDIDIELSEHEYMSVVDILIDRGYLESWGNDDEFKVISAQII